MAVPTLQLLNRMPLQLTEDQKQAIRAEEIFREQVREELANQHRDHHNRVWTFLNSAFGLWLLSSVFLAVITWAWTTILEKRTTEKKNAATLVQLRVELDRDFWEFSGAFAPAWDFTRYSKAFALYLQRPNYHFSDFKDKTVDDLLWIMGTIPPEANTKDAQKLQSSIEKIWKLIEPFELTISLSPDQKDQLDTRITDILQRDMFPIVEK